MKKYISFCKKLNDVMVFIGVLLIVFAVCLTFVQVVTRNLMSFSFPWADEVTRYVVIYAVYFASGSVYYLDQNAKVDILYNYFPKKLQGVLSVIFNLLTAVFLLIMAYYGYIYVQRNMSIWCTSVRIPWAVPFASLILGAVNMLIQVPAKIYQNITELILD